MARLRESGMLLQSARGPIANVADLIAGEEIKGSWWGHVMVAAATLSVTAAWQLLPGCLRPT